MVGDNPREMAPAATRTRDDPRRRLHKQFLRLIIASFLPFFGLWVLFDPILHSGSLMRLLSKEDRLVEWFTAVAFFSAGVIGVRTIRRLRGSGLSRFSWVIPAAGFIGCAEETSWGRKIFGFSRPVVNGKEIDALHDFFDVGAQILARHVSGPTLVASALVVLIVVVFALVGLWQRAPGSRRPSPALGYLLIAIPLAATSTVVDFVETHRLAQVTRYGFAMFLEELLEWYAACAVLFASLALSVDRDMRCPDPPR